MNKQIITFLPLSLSILAASGIGIKPETANNFKAPMEDINNVTDNTLDSLNLVRTARPVAGSSRKDDNPVLFLIGNSTMRTGTLGNGQNGQWGWGYYFPDFFDQEKITVENHALGGMSSRTFYNRLWGEVIPGIRPGDWVIIELGHNDNGEYDSGRARASIPGIGNDSLQIVIKETGEKETVYTYGEYMRRFVNDVKKRGAYPILFSLTPRNAWDDKDSTIISRVNHTFGKWAKEVAESENVPFVDLNEITAEKYERFGKDKVKTMFYLDRIHTSEFGAKVNAQSAAEGLRKLENAYLKYFLKPEEKDTITGKSRQPGRPVVFIIGDSTVKNEDSGDDSMWGWGSVISECFDTTKVSMENHAMAGRSARTYLDEGRWDKVYNALQPGDFVIIQFGHNDGGDINTGKARGELHGTGNESKVFKMEKTGINQVVYTYGWYLRKFIMDAKEKGAIPIVLSHTPRNKWQNGIIESNSTTFGLWAREAAKQGGAYFIDLNSISGRKLQTLGSDKTSEYFKNDHTHSSKKGARLNAVSICDGLLNTDCTLKDFIIPKSYNFSIDNNIPSYNDYDGFGYDFNTKPSVDGNNPFYFSVCVPDGNYLVTVTLGNNNYPSSTTVRAESRRLMIDEKKVKRKKREKITFLVNKRSAAINLSDSVILNPRETGTLTWDDKLTFEFTGTKPAVSEIKIRPIEENDSVTTLYFCGDSTVTDQTTEPWTSWGQIIPAYFDDHIAISNHAESGESISSFIEEKRLTKVLSMAKPGDYIFIEFGHNDQKEHQPGSGAYYNFTHNLKILVDKSKAAGLNVVLVTPTARRSFDKDGTILQTHNDYPDAMKTFAEREQIPLIDLNTLTMRLYEGLGEEKSKRIFVHYPAGSYPGQQEPLKDNTHFNPYGATQIAKCMIEQIKAKIPALAPHITYNRTYNISSPDDIETFYWPNARFIDFEKPYGN